MFVAAHRVLHDISHGDTDNGPLFGGSHLLPDVVHSRSALPDDRRVRRGWKLWVNNVTRQCRAWHNLRKFIRHLRTLTFTSSFAHSFANDRNPQTRIIAIAFNVAPISKQQLTLCVTLLHNIFSDVEESLLDEADETDKQAAAVVLDRWFRASKRDRKIISITNVIANGFRVIRACMSRIR